MKKTRFIAIFLCLTLVFAMLAGGAYAVSNESAYIDEATIVIEDGKVVSGDASLVDKGIIVIGDEDTSANQGTSSVADDSYADIEGYTVSDGNDATTGDYSAPDDSYSDTESSVTDTTSGKQPVKDNSALVSPDSSTGTTQSGVSLPAETPTYVQPTFPFGTANRALGDTLYNGSWDTTIYDLMIMHYTKQVTTTMNLNITHMARANNGTDSTPTTNGKYTKEFAGEFFRINAGADVTVENTTDRRGGVVVLDGLRAYYDTYDLNSDGSNSASSGFLTDLNVWGNWSYPNWEKASPVWFDPIIIQDGGKSTFKETTFQNGLADEDGAGMRLNGGEFNMSNGAFRHCRAKTNGGALYIASGTAVLNTVTFDNCTAGSNGGAIYMTGGTLTLTGCTITNCSATNGGAIYVTGSATITLTNTTVSGNKATNTNGSGGAMYIGANSTVNVEGTSKINSNLAYDKGGAIRVATSGKLNVSGSTQINSNDFYQYVAPEIKNYALSSNGGKFRGTGASLYQSEGSGFGDSKFGDTNYNDFHSGKLNDDNTSYAGNTSIGIRVSATNDNASGSVYLVFQLSQSIIITDVTVYTTKNNTYFGTFYANDVNAYVSNSNSTSNLTNKLTATNDPTGTTTRNYTFSGSSQAWKYVIIDVNVPGGGYHVCVNEVVINGYVQTTAAATNTYGGGIYAEGQVNMTGGSISSNTATYGGAVYVASGTHSFSADMKNNVADGDASRNNGNTAGWGGAIYVASGEATYSGGEMSGNYAEVDGGGICSYGGTANITGGTIKDNRADQGGGAYVKAPGGLTMSNGTITSNEFGGGVFVYNGCNFTMSNGTISSNTPNSTHKGGGVVIYNNNGGTFTMTGGTISGHSGAKGHGVGQTGNGGTINISGGTISGNTPGANGGGIYVEAGTCTISGTASITANTATGYYGGGVYMGANTTLTISGGTIGGAAAANGNSALVGGGVFMASDSTLTMSNGTIKYNKATGTSTTATDVGVRGGGGIYAGTGTHVYLQHGEISYNSSAVEESGGGGGVYVYKAQNFILGKGTGTTDPATGIEAADLNYKIRINNNFGTLADSCTRDGGGICSRDAGVWIFNCEINNNSANYGAGVYVTISSSNTTTYKVTYINGTIDGNKVGGGVFLSSAQLTMTMYGGSIDNNTLSYSEHVHGGAGICACNGASVVMKGGSVSDNDSTTTKSPHGGGIVIKRPGSLTVTGGNIDRNTTTGDGGGIYPHTEVKLSIIGTADSPVSISGNEAGGTGGGGGIYLNTNTGLDGGAVPIQYAVINGNKAHGVAADGGGIIATATNVNMSNCTVSNNATTDTAGGSNGGGVYFPSSGYSLNVSNCKFIGNTTYNWGGGLYGANPATFTISNTSFDGNKSNKLGGGMMLYGGVKATVSGCYFGNNEAGFMTEDASDGTGGAISIMDASASTTVELALENTYVGKLLDKNGNIIDAGNTAKNLGGGIYVSEYSILTLSGAIDISNNESTTSSGGGIYFIEDAKVPEFVGVNFSNNKAAKNGGAISVAYSAISANNTLVFKGCTFTNNTAGGDGGAVRSTNAVLTVNNNEVAGNSVMRGNEAGGRGGAVYAVNTTGAAPTVANFFKLSGTLYEDNEANTDKMGNDGFGGAIYVSCANGYITNNEFYGNKVYVSTDGDGNDGSGGAVYVVGTAVANSKLEFSINTVGKQNSGNRADSYGGGLAIGGFTKAAILRGSFNYNHAKDGGGIYAYECTDGLLITPYKSEIVSFLGRSDSGVTDASEANSYTTIQNNTCNTNGAGLNLATGATLKNVKILNNVSGFDGGGMCVQSGKSVTMTGLNTIQGNTAANFGGGVIILTTGRLTIEGNAAGTNKTVVTQNKITGSSSGGAGVHVATGSTFTMSYGEITNNDASKTAAGANSTGHGGGLDITGGFATLTGVTVTGNKSGGNGGGIALDDNDNNQGSLEATNCVISGNSSGANGGGISVADHTTATVGSTVVKGNTAANGGGVSVGDYASVTMTSSYIVENTANGTMAEGGTTMSGTVSGVGGGVAVFDGSSFSLTGTGAIYGNSASVAANDVFANGSSTSLNIPAASAMDTNGATINGVTITGFDAQGKTTGWWEDYKNGETNYANGLYGDVPPAFRYADGPVSVAAYTTAAESTRYINEDGRFVSITFDVQKLNYGSITITAPSADDANQRFVFTISGTTIKNEQVNISISLLPDKSVTIEKLYPGTYTITQETSWSWRYDFNGVQVDEGTVQMGSEAVVVEIKGTSVVEVHTVKYTNTKDSGLWLSHNSPVATNKATIQAVAYAVDMTEAKRRYVI